MKIRAGIQIGRLTAADSLGRGGDGTTLWRCDCSCGDWLAVDPIGPENDGWIRRAAGCTWDYWGNHGPIVCAWGARGGFMDRGQEVRGILEDACNHVRPSVLQLTKAGHPSHPLYLRKTLRPRLWTR
jgi:hypothetical protein